MGGMAQLASESPVCPTRGGLKQTTDIGTQRPVTLKVRCFPADKAVAFACADTLILLSSNTRYEPLRYNPRRWEWYPLLAQKSGQLSEAVSGAAGYRFAPANHH